MSLLATGRRALTIAGAFLLGGQFFPAFAATPSMNQAEDFDDPPLTAEQQALVAKLTETELKAIDLALLANAHTQWRKVARIVGTTMSALAQRPKDVLDVFYAQRIQRLVAAGALEAQGNLKRMRFSEVRIPAKLSIVSPNPSIERTTSGLLRSPTVASHVKR